MNSSPRPTASLVSTSDRYDLHWERETLRGLLDLDVSLVSGLPTSECELVTLARDADAILFSSREAMTAAIFASLPRLRVVCRYAVGLDHVDLDAATAHGVVVSHCPGYCTPEVADHALGMILALNRNIVAFDRHLRAGAWREHSHHMDRLLPSPIPAMRTLTIGVVGFGRIGRAVVERLRPFGSRVVVADPFVPDGVVRGAGAEPVALDELLRSSDIVTLHCPLSPATLGLIGHEQLRRMKRGSKIVNTARGPLIDLTALATALTDGHLGGAALDVVYPEPFPADSPIAWLDNVVLTPHAAYYSEQSIEVVRVETLNAALDVLRGITPKVVANPAVLDRLALAARDDESGAIGA